MPEPPGGQRGRDGKGDAIGKAEDRAKTRGRGDAADGGAERSPTERRHHQRQRRQIKQQQRDQRARDDRGEHQRRRAAGGYGNEDDRDHQLSRSFRAVRAWSARFRWFSKYLRALQKALYQFPYQKRRLRPTPL